MVKDMKYTILYNGFLGLRVIQGIYWDNGKENGNSYPLKGCESLIETLQGHLKQIP